MNGIEVVLLVFTLGIEVVVLVFTLGLVLAIAVSRRRGEPEPETYVTASGRVLTDDDIQALADEAERGYDVSGITDVFVFPQVRPLPKAIRQADVFRSDF